MKSKQIFTLAIVLALLILGVAVKQTHERPEVVTEEFAPLDLSFDKNKVTKITLADTEVQLVKVNDRWQAANFNSARVDPVRIDQFLSEIQKMKGELRGSGKEVLDDFGISDEKGARILLADNDKEILNLVVGTAQAPPGMVFIRKHGQQDVYLSESQLLSMMGITADPQQILEPEHWAARNIADYDPAKVTRLEIQNYKDGVATNVVGLEKEGGVWKFAQEGLPFGPAAEKVQQYLTSAKSYMSSKVLDPKAQDFGFSKPNLGIKLVMEDGQGVTFTAGKLDEPASGYYLQVSSEPVVFLLSKYYLENLAPEYPWFFPENPLNVDPEKTEKLTLRADKIQMTFEPMKKKWDALTAYLESLKGFRAEKFADKKPKFGKYELEIQKQGEAPMILDFADISSKDIKAYAFQKRDHPHVLTISDAVFKQLFENPSALAEPQKVPGSSD